MNILSGILISLCGCVNIHAMFAYFYPEEYKNAAINFMTYVVQFCTIIEYNGKKLYVQLMKYPQTTVIINMITNIRYYFTKRIEVVKYADFEMCIYSDYDNFNKLGVINKIIQFRDALDLTLDVYNKDNVLGKLLSQTPIVEFEYDECSFKFISCVLTLTIDGKIQTYTIKLHSANENYYIVNNKINKYVFVYLLKYQYNITCIDVEQLTYILEILDNNANFIKLNETHEILFLKNNYEMNHQKCLKETTSAKTQTDKELDKEFKVNEPSDTDLSLLFNVVDPSYNNSCVSDNINFQNKDNDKNNTWVWGLEWDG
jgi:hypothetical protein